MYWGSGLSYNLTKTTDPKYWPGSNKLGAILESLRSTLRSSGNAHNGEKSSSSGTDVTALTSATTSRGRTAVRASQRSHSLSPSLRNKKVDSPLLKVFLKQKQQAKRRKRESSINSADDNPEISDNMDTASESSFVSTRDQETVTEKLDNI